MGVSILDPHPNNECLNIGASEAWFSFIFCGSRMDSLNLHAYDYYSGLEVALGKDVVYQEVPALDNKLNIWNYAGNGLRVNIRDFVKDASVFNNDGEYTWRAEIVQNVDVDNADISKRRFPDNMIHEGVLSGEPGFYTKVNNIQNFDYDNYLPFVDCYKNRIKPPYYVDFLDSKYENTAYDIPVTFDKTQLNNDGTEYSVIKLDAYSSTAKNLKDLVRPAKGSNVYIHKKKCYGVRLDNSTLGDNQFYIDTKISGIAESESETKAVEGCYIKIGNKYYLVKSYDMNTGIIECHNGEEIKSLPAGTHYSIYTTHFWTPYYYFRVHQMPRFDEVSAEFHERRRLDPKNYDMFTNCIENTCNGILFKAKLAGDSHSAVKYHYWDIYDTSDDRLIYHTEKIYSEELDCEVFVPFGRKYKGRITVVTQDEITVRGETEYYLPLSPAENNKRFNLRAYQNKFGGIELAWNYNYWYDGSSLLKCTDFEVFREDRRTNEVKYLGKVDCSPIGIEGVTPAASGSNWYLIDKDCDFKLKTPRGANINMYLVGGGCDGGGWTSAPNNQNKSFCVGQDGGEGGFFIKKSTVCDGGILQGKAKIAQRNDPQGTTLKIGSVVHKCSDSGSARRGSVKNNTMTQLTNGMVMYNNDAENGANGFSTSYGYVGSSGGGGAACGNNRGIDGSKTLSISGITPKYNDGSSILIDRRSLEDCSGEFDLTIPEGVKVNVYLVGGGSDGTKFTTIPNTEDYEWDNNGTKVELGYGGDSVLVKKVELNGTVHCSAVIADANDKNGTILNFGSDNYKCNDNGSVQKAEGGYAIARHPRNGNDWYEPATPGADGVKTPYGYVGSSGGGGGVTNGYEEAKRKGCWYGAKGGSGAGNGGNVTNAGVTNGMDATNYGCGGGCASIKEIYYYNGGLQYTSKPGKGMPGCIIFEIAKDDVLCPDPGKGGIGAGDGEFPGEDGDNAVNYGSGGGGAGYWADNSNGDYTVGNVGKGMQGCIILEIDLSGLEGGSDGEQVYAVDWTAGSDKNYRYIVTGCNYESSYKASRHGTEDMIECTAYVDVTPHFKDFYLYFLNDADTLVKTEYDLENYDTPLTEPMGRYVTARNNPYRMMKRHIHSLAVELNSKAFYRRHTWRIEGDVELGEVTHNVTRNVNPLYAKMPSVTVEPTDYDSFPVSFLFGYLECDTENSGDFVYDDQYMFELWKQCVFAKQTVMIKDPKGNVWTGVITGHNYQVEYDTDGMPYTISFDFTQTRTEYNTLVMIVDSHNEYLKTAKGNHLK